MLLAAVPEVVQTILESLGNILVSLWTIVVQLVGLLLTAPFLAVLAWCGFWLFAVDWTSLRQVLLKGGWIPVALVGVVMVLGWQQIIPDSLSVLGLSQLSGYVEKTVYVSGLFSLMFICGAIQLTGCFDGCCSPRAESSEAEAEAEA